MFQSILVLVARLEFIRWGGTKQDRDGTNYITTGAGMALSNAALQRLMSCSACNCRAPDAPDDMSLGTWFRNLGIEACLS